MNESVDAVWLDDHVHIVLITALSTLLGLAPILLVLRLAPDMPLRWSLWFYPLVALEGATTTRWLGYPRHRSARTLSFRLGELLTLVILLRLLTWATVSGWPGKAGVALWLIDPATFFDPAFLLLLLLLLIVWGQTLHLTQLFGRLALQPDERAARKRAREDRWSERGPAYESRRRLVDRLTGSWLAGAFLLIVVAALSQFTVTPEKTLRLGLRPTSLPSEFVFLLVFYLLGGLYLRGEAYRGALRVQWHYERTTWQEDFRHRWRRVAFFLLIVAAVLAGLVPIGSTEPLAPLAQGALVLLAELGYALMTLFLFLLSLLLSPFHLGESAHRSAPPPQEILRQGRPGPHLPIPPWLGGAMLWLGAAILVLGLAVLFWRERGFLLTWARVRQWLLALLAWKGKQRRRLRALGSVRVPQVTLSRQWARRVPHLSLPVDLTRWRRLTPDQRVRYYYIRTLERARRAGLPRHPPETPLEYERTLETQVPAADEEAHLLTAAFVRARYAREAIQPEEVPWVRRAWERLKRVLRPRRG